MKRNILAAGSLATLMLAFTSAQASDGRLATDRLDEVLEQVTAFGFQHIQEIEAKGRDSVEVEGWLDDEWQAEVRLSLENGESLEEERKRRDGGAWGMSEEDIRLAMEAAVAEGLAEFEEIQVDRDGRIEIEGRDADGREIEVRTRQGESGATDVERD
ncbi:PepSY domain-containing protein [Halomonas sp. MCCC 1A17488]|uniref:PepSY domain-containing protein n=1 Tax=Billgrantia sulfidoxydans TaxID=2733484 RepID=A0ABX7W1W1_9GAMM|nr:MULTISPECIES: PepSY domain-containing protein [Halomonas]MCE8016188.1 PepSY domain-containing protein [Halomonas sp. MCCC 1A17488]MCG3239521.1 PepSY domain-containing protein [Halomonas sp. MCCC 1A17488]QPP50558.1 PepSY domain-containing protein [Halomonas sp. SS10-MC5]QTP54145.1 PepSY domain-containing protein [Halomonas sulfidoxydans]